MKKEIRNRILDAIRAEEGNLTSNFSLARKLDINPSQLSQILNGKTEKVLSDAKWIMIARRLDVPIRKEDPWNVAKTPVFEYINQALSFCQENSLSGMLCDRADIGKTYSAKYYARHHKHVAYIDCSRSKSRQLLIRRIAHEFGLPQVGKYQTVYDDLIFFLNNALDRPLIILDEAGDLDSRAFLEIKALWNATEHAVGWYMMGADGLKAKIERNLTLQTVGYTEIFSRYGSRFQKIVPPGKEEAEEFIRHQVAAIALANGAPSSEIQKIYAKTKGSLRRIYIEVKKLKNEKSAISHAIN